MKHTIGFDERQTWRIPYLINAERNKWAQSSDAEIDFDGIDFTTETLPWMRIIATKDDLNYEALIDMSQPPSDKIIRNLYWNLRKAANLP